MSTFVPIVLRLRKLRQEDHMNIKLETKQLSNTMRLKCQNKTENLSSGMLLSMHAALSSNPTHFLRPLLQLCIRTKI